MTSADGPQGLSAEARSQLLKRMAQARQSRATAPASASTRAPLGVPEMLDHLRLMQKAGEALPVANPFFRLHEGRAGATTQVDGREILNFTSYNYLALNGHAEVSKAAMAAIERYGTSVSGSRIVSGERPVHAELEAELAAVYSADACVVMVSGHATNVTVIGCLVTPGDAVVYDALSHNSIIQGAVLSGATRRAFAHNSAEDLDRQLRALRANHKRLLVVIEGQYSMDGDIADLPGILEVVRRHGAYLMVDEAHSLGQLGATGAGLAEHYAMDPRSVDLWMGTLSKSLASCGGYVAGHKDIIHYLRATAPGFLYSVGMPAPTAAAALAALRVMRKEPWRVTQLHKNSALFRDTAHAANLDTGGCEAKGIVPIMIGSSIRTALLTDALWERGIGVQPIQYPGVPERTARLRCFVCADHTSEQIHRAVEAIADLHATLPKDTGAFARLIAGAARAR